MVNTFGTGKFKYNIQIIYASYLECFKPNLAIVACHITSIDDNARVGAFNGFNGYCDRFITVTNVVLTHMMPGCLTVSCGVKV
jgi:hypothetical protein